VKWANSKLRMKSIAISMVFTVITIALITIWFISLRMLPAEMSPPLAESHIGELISQKHPSPMDPLLKECNANHILDAIIKEKLDLATEGQLIRFAIGKNNIYWKELLDFLKDNDVPVFWRESGINLAYRTLYIKNEIASQKFLEEFLQKHPDYGISQVIIEKIHNQTNLGSQELVMVFSDFWPIKLNE
jgi:hypothetical protein